MLHLIKIPTAVLREDFPLAETVGFEPTCRANGSLISSQERYDLFATSPHLFSVLGQPGAGLGLTRKAPGMD